MVQHLLLKEEDRDFLYYNLIHKKINDLKRIIKNIDDCGKLKRLEFHCKSCRKQDHPSLCKAVKQKVYCDSRYCFNPYCINERFARRLQSFKDLKTFKNLDLLWHFVIGFEPVSLDDFKNNYTKIRKRQEYVLSNFWRKLVKSGIQIKGLRVTDYSFESEGKVYIHYHFGAEPLRKTIRRSNMIKLKSIEKSMNQNMRVKTPFYLKSFGYKKKEAIFSYLAKRSAGLYKYGEGKNLQWGDYRKGKLIEDVKSGKYLGLKDFINLLQYYDDFYNTRNCISVGGLPQACIPVHSSVNDFTIVCLQHGQLDSKDIILEIFDAEGG